MYTKKQKVVLTGISTGLAVMNMFRWYRLMRVLWRTDGLREQMEKVWRDGGTEAKPEVRPEPEEMRTVPRKRATRNQQGKASGDTAAAHQPRHQTLKDY